MFLNQVSLLSIGLIEAKSYIMTVQRKIPRFWMGAICGSKPSASAFCFSHVGAMIRSSHRPSRSPWSRGIERKPGYRLSSVVDGGQIVTHHSFNALCFLGIVSRPVFSTTLFCLQISTQDHIPFPSFTQAQTYIQCWLTSLDFKIQISGDCFHVPWSRFWSHRVRRGIKCCIHTQQIVNLDVPSSKLLFFKWIL